MALITLAPDIEHIVTEQAKRQGTTLDLLVSDIVRQAFGVPPPVPSIVEGEAMADYLKEFIGCVDSSKVYPEGSRLSENTGRKFAEGMAENAGRENCNVHRG